MRGEKSNGTKTPIKHIERGRKSEALLYQDSGHLGEKVKKTHTHKMDHNSSGVELTAFAQLPTDIKYEIDHNLEITDSEQVILKPGSKIRPQVSEEEAVRLAERLYGISTRDISELVSYDDKNFLIHVDT